MSGATMSEASEVLVSRDGAIATLTINRPRAKNSLNRAVFDGLRAQLVQLRDDDTVRAVIITGAEGVFCAGADITAFDALRAEPLLGDRAAAGGHFWSELERFPKPVIAAVEKLALGGGTELALACDIAPSRCGRTGSRRKATAAISRSTLQLAESPGSPLTWARPAVRTAGLAASR